MAQSDLNKVKSHRVAENPLKRHSNTLMRGEESSTLKLIPSCNIPACRWNAQRKGRTPGITIPNYWWPDANIVLLSPILLATETGSDG